MATVDYSKPSHPPRFDHRILDLTGQRFERLFVVRFAGRTSKDQVAWECLCDCGSVCYRTSNELRNKIERSRRRSCGCLIGDVNRGRATVRDFKGTPAFHSWKAMKERCNQPSATGFERYGGRGIKVCDRWQKSFFAFLEDMGQPDQEGLSIDRIDNDGNYEPGNCRWATRVEQANNRRKKTLNLVIEFNGEAKTLPEWAESLGVDVGTLYARRWQGLPIEQVLVGNKRKHHFKAS